MQYTKILFAFVVGSFLLPIGSAQAVSVSWQTSSQSSPEFKKIVNVVLELDSISALPVFVPFSLSGTATQQVDYLPPTQQVTIPAGAMTATITIKVRNDPIPETNETIILTMGAPVNASQGAFVVHTITVIDDD